MKRTVQLIARAIRRSQLIRYPLLAFAPMFVRPLGFIGPEKSWYARLRRLWTAPLAGAGLGMSGGKKMLLWVWLQKGATAFGAAGAYQQLTHFTDLGSYCFFAMIAVGLYAIACTRWTYHRTANLLFRKLGLDVPRIPLLYFIVTTATWGFWFGASLHMLTWLLTQSSTGSTARIQDAMIGHPDLVLVSVLAVGLATQIAARNAWLGTRAVYADSLWLAGAVKVGSIALLAPLAVILTIL
ncbi:hypothetical protein GO293_02290 [Ralstonia solanacearum]|nr:hypothetical protein [Ralstonia solanacearum]